MQLKSRHYRLLNLLTMLDTSDMLKTKKINERDLEMLEAIDRLKLECKLAPLFEETLGQYDDNITVRIEK